MLKNRKCCILFITILILGCSRKTDNFNSLNMKGKWADILCEQPPLILFDYDKTEQKDQYSFDFVLYRLQFEDNKKEFLCKLPYNKKGGALHIDREKKRIVYLVDDIGVAEVNLETGDTNLIEIEGEIYSPQYINQDKLSFITNSNLYIYQRDSPKELIVSSCDYTSDGWDTYTWLTSDQELVYASSPENGKCYLLEFDRSTGESSVLLEENSSIKFKFSNNQKKFIYRTKEGIFLYDRVQKIATSMGIPNSLSDEIKSICFSPDDELIAFSYVYDDGSYLNSYEIWMMEVDTKELSRIYKKTRASGASVTW